jgi:hypothetical protein
MMLLMVMVMVVLVVSPYIIIAPACNPLLLVAAPSCCPG